MGADDKHLKFRVSIFKASKQQYNINVTTLVEYNNRMGQVYMTLIRPFHHIVVKSMVKQAYAI